MLEDWRTAGLTPKLYAACELVEKLTRDSDAVTAADLDRVRAAGVSDAGIREAAYVCAMFSTIVRVADALGWDVPTEFSSSRTSLVKFGYRLPPLM